MANRICRAVCLDVHGVLFERSGQGARSPDESAEIGRAQHAECYRQGMQRVFGGNVNLTIDAQALWRDEERALEAVPREDRRGHVRHHREFLEAVNLQTLELHFPELMNKLPDVTKRRLAHEVRRIRRDSLRFYVMHDDMRAFLASMHNRGILMYLATGLERKRLLRLIHQCEAQVEREYITHVFSASEIGVNKLSSRFWQEMLRRIGFEPHELVMVGNSVSIDSSCTEVGIPAIILDRGGLQESFYRPGGEQSRRGIRLIGTSDEIPPRAPFISFARSPGELHKWLERFDVR